MKTVGLLRCKTSDGYEFGAIELSNGDIICGHCGYIFTKKEFERDGNTVIEGCMTWGSFSKRIINWVSNGDYPDAMSLIDEVRC